jgi:hypothetical protein
MHLRLVSYLRDNRDQIIENWLTEAEIPSPQGGSAEFMGEGVVPYAFFASAFEDVVARLEGGSTAKSADDAAHLSSFLGLTCECKQRCFGGRVCMELHDSGLMAFMSVFADDWDAAHEFSELDRECSKDLINHALSGFFGREIELCAHRIFRKDCPFAAQN